MLQTKADSDGDTAAEAAIFDREQAITDAKSDILAR